MPKFNIVVSQIHEVEAETEEEAWELCWELWDKAWTPEASNAEGIIETAQVAEICQ